MGSSLQIDRPMRLLVTGAGGFVGSHVVRSARRAGLEVIACDLQGAAAESSLALDVRDTAACERIMRQTQPTHVLHAAAITDGPDADVLEVNAQGAKNLLLAASQVYGIERCVLLSSSAVYGVPVGCAVSDERDPLKLSSVYSRSKRLAELFLHDLEHETGVPMVAARLGPCYGATEVAGPFRPRVSLVGRLMDACRRGVPLRVSGEDYARDWTDVDQAAEALLLLLAQPGLRHRIYNVSTGRAIAASDLIRCFRDLGLQVTWTDTVSADFVLHGADARLPLRIDRLCQDTRFCPRHDWQERIAFMLRESFPEQPVRV